MVEGLQGHFEKQIATWWRNWFFPPWKWLHDASFDCMLSKCLTEIIWAIPRVTLSFSPGQLCLASDFVHVKVSLGKILRGKKFLCSIQISNHCSRHPPPPSPIPFPPERQGLLLCFVIMNEWMNKIREYYLQTDLLKPLWSTLALLLKVGGGKDICRSRLSDPAETLQSILQTSKYRNVPSVSIHSCAWNSLQYFR